MRPPSVKGSFSSRLDTYHATQASWLYSFGEQMLVEDGNFYHSSGNQRYTVVAGKAKMEIPAGMLP
jgi:hypothetical protein